MLQKFIEEKRVINLQVRIHTSKWFHQSIFKHRSALNQAVATLLLKFDINSFTLTVWKINSFFSNRIGSHTNTTAQLATKVGNSTLINSYWKKLSKSTVPDCSNNKFYINNSQSLSWLQNRNKLKKTVSIKSATARQFKPLSFDSV